MRNLRTPKSSLQGIESYSCNLKVQENVNVGYEKVDVAQEKVDVGDLKADDTSKMTR